MATVTTSRPNFSAGGSFHDVDWATYCQLNDDPAFEHRWMTYLDGDLTIMSPHIVHDYNSRMFLFVVAAVARASRIEFMPIGTTTLKKEGGGPLHGAGKEPDEGLYLNANVARMIGKKELDLAIDPPPDLAIEVDNSVSSEIALAIYARIGVPEVWRFDVKEKTLWFVLLEGDHYRAVDRSQGLPRLTPRLVMEALEAQADQPSWLEWLDWLDAWARNLAEPDREVI
jgi:Uma2 family endonuclease